MPAKQTATAQRAALDGPVTHLSTQLERSHESARGLRELAGQRMKVSLSQISLAQLAARSAGLQKTHQL